MMDGEQPRDLGQLLNLREQRAFGKLYEAINVPGVRDVLAQVFDESVAVWIDDGAGLRRLGGLKISATELLDLAAEIIATGGRHIDELEPCADVRLGKGVRVHAVLPPVSKDGVAISIRMPNTAAKSLHELIKNELCDEATASYLFEAVEKRKNILITGATASGKTTLLAALMSESGHSERLITIEDVAEITLRHPHHVALEARQSNSEGVGLVTLERLLREALRMRPDRLILGECRGAEIATLLTAFNTGHAGGASTIHTNSLAATPARLEALGALAGLSPEALAMQAVSAIDLVIHLSRSGSKHEIQELGFLRLDKNNRLEIERFEVEETVARK